MKKLICCLIAAIFVMCEGAQAEKAINLHVIGETDWQSDQAYKLIVRDWTLEYIADGTDDLAEKLNDRAESEGHARSITVETGVFPYPDGDQPAIRVRIGKAEGRNWWSLLYPEQAGMTDDVIYYSAVVDWLLRLFGLE